MATQLFHLYLTTIQSFLLLCLFLFSSGCSWPFLSALGNPLINSFGSVEKYIGSEDSNRFAFDMGALNESAVSYNRGSHTQ